MSRSAGVLSPVHWVAMLDLTWRDGTERRVPEARRLPSQGQKQGYLTTYYRAGRGTMVESWRGKMRELPQISAVGRTR
jgi:hypothetical protein